MLVQDFMVKYRVSGDVTFVTDFVEESPLGYGQIPRRKWLVTLRSPVASGPKENTEVSFDYSTGAQESDPSLMFAVYCAGSDCRYGSMDFEEFLSEFGEDNVAEQYRTWKACKAASPKFYDWVSSEAMWRDFIGVESDE